MKIAKDRLKQIIKEELQNEMHGGDYEVDPDGYEGHMAKTNLYKIAEYAQELHDLIHDDENLEPWVEEKIAVAAHMMDAVGHYMQYNASRAGEEDGGEGEWEQPSPADRHGYEDEGDEEEFYIAEELTLGEADEAPAEGEEKVVRVYDFDGVIGEFSPELKQKFFEMSQQEGSKITGTEIQKPSEPFYVISKFSNPSYVFKVPYYDELREFLEKNGLDLREAPNAVPTKKATIIKKFLERIGTKASGILISDNTKDNSKLSKAASISPNHKGENVTYMVYAANTADGKKESSMIKSGLVEGGAAEDKVKVVFSGMEQVKYVPDLQKI